MIEFKGIYHHPPNEHAIPVLVQFDGTLLHVWHMPEPFHRLFSSDLFHLDMRHRNSRPSIKLPNGARIDTEDIHADIFFNHPTFLKNRHSSKIKLQYSVLFGSILFVALIFAIWTIAN